MVSIRLNVCPDFNVFTRIIEGELIDVDHSIYSSLDDARRVFLEEASRRRVYGFCTGLGSLYDVKGECSPHWEYKVLLEHAVGSGSKAPPDVVRLFLFIRVLQASRGRDPIRGVVLKRIVDALNNGIIPLVPLRGSLGASGDLVPSAHAFLCLYYGEGEALYRGSIVSCFKALTSSGLDVLSLEPGEALILINNTSWSTALLVHAMIRLEDLMKKSLRVARRSLEICRCTSEHYEPTIGLIKEHNGIRRVLELLGTPNCGSPVRLQDPYSLRCIPQVYGAVIDFIDYAKSIASKEYCSTSTNPIVENSKVVHSCSFYALHLALIADSIAIGLAHIASIIERRIAQLMRNEITGLPEFLALSSPVGVMISHYIASALTARIKTLASPSSIHSTPVSGLQEDITPQAVESLIKLQESIDILEELVELENSIIEKALALKK